MIDQDCLPRPPNTLIYSSCIYLLFLLKSTASRLRDKLVGFGALNSIVNSVQSVDPSIRQLNIRPPLVSFLPLNAIRHILRFSGSLICIQNSLFTLLAHSPFVLNALNELYLELSSDEMLTRNPCLPSFTVNGGTYPT